MGKVSDQALDVKSLTVQSRYWQGIDMSEVALAVADYPALIFCICMLTTNRYEKYK